MDLLINVCFGIIVICLTVVTMVLAVLTIKDMIRGF